MTDTMSGTSYQNERPHHTCMTHPDHETALSYFREVNDERGERPVWMDANTFATEWHKECRRRLAEVHKCTACNAEYARSVAIARGFHGGK